MAEIMPETRLWQTVIFQAVIDATAKGDSLEKRRAAEWLRENRRDFKQVCAMAGLDPDFISEAFCQGRIRRSVLKNARGLIGDAANITEVLE